jgi:hypothetical protein
MAASTSALPVVRPPHRHLYLLRAGTSAQGTRRSTTSSTRQAALLVEQGIRANEYITSSRSVLTFAGSSNLSGVL